MSGGERLLLSAVAVIIFYVFVLVLLSFCVFFYFRLHHRVNVIILSIVSCV